jgi:hypothetical protein
MRISPQKKGGKRSEEAKSCQKIKSKDKAFM